MGLLGQLSMMMSLAIVLFLVWVLRAQAKNRKAVQGHVWATFYTTIGTSYDVLCRVEGNLVEAPAQALQRHPRVKGYVIGENKTFDKPYPKGRPSWLQTIVQHTAYYEGNTEPIIDRDPEKRGVPVGTPQVLQNLQDEKMTRLMVQDAEEVDRLRKIIATRIDPRIMYVLIGIAIMLTAGNIFLVMNMNDQVAALAHLWGL